MKRLLFFFLFGLIITSSVSAVNLSVLATGNEITMKDVYEDGGPRFVATPNPFTVIWDESGELSVTSNRDIAQMTFAVAQSGVVLAQETFSLTAGDVETLYLTDLEPGTYTVIITTPLGTNLQGTLVID